MKRFFLSLGLAIIAATPSFAADKGGQQHAAPMIAEAPPAVSWSGCSIAVGAARETTVQTAEIDGIGIDLGAKGTLASLGIGCDYQIDRVVVGGIARYAMGIEEGSIANGELRWKADRKWMVVARAGHLITDNLLAYALAGVHGLNQDLSFASFRTSAHPTGFVGGLGLEARLTRHVSLRLEGDWSTSSMSLADEFGGLKLKPETQTVRAEVVWHFVSMK